MLCALLLVVSGAIRGKDVVEFKAGLTGKVTFSHKKHAETLKID